MKNLIILIITAALCPLVCSCELETSGNGNLDGMWRLASIDTLATEGVNTMDGERIFWSFQGRLLQLEDKNGASPSVLFRFEHSGDTLRLYDPYIYDRENGDYPLKNVPLLYPFGVSALDEEFTITRLSGGKMILETEALRLKFIKL